MNYIILVIAFLVLTFLYSCSGDKITSPNVTPQKTEITIGTQIWQTKNLEVTTYRNGDQIPEVKDSAKWAKLNTGAWCYYKNDPAMGAIYGKLYNWYAVNDPRGLAPAGWHVPSDTEWTTLATFLGDEDVAGSKMKDTGTSHWLNPNTDATNESGFTALPGGYHFLKANELGSKCYLWSSTEHKATMELAVFRELTNIKSNLPSIITWKLSGMSVRCVKDN